MLNKTLAIKLLVVCSVADIKAGKFNAIRGSEFLARNRERKPSAYRLQKHYVRYRTDYLPSSR